MSTMNRREFIGKTAAAVGSVLGGPALALEQTGPASRPAKGKVLLANDLVTLGKTGIKTSRLSLGTGMASGREAKAAGLEGMVKLLRYALDQGIRWWDTADSYKTHPVVKVALKEVKRDQVVITTKTQAKDAANVRKDIERFFKELNTDYIDILLLHCLKDGDWPKKMKGPMDVFNEYKAKGRIRAVGVSCHGMASLKAAAEVSWIEFIMARINPFAYIMDVDKPERVNEVVELLKKMHKRGTAICGMKILGGGHCKTDKQIDESLNFTLRQRYLDGFSIGFSRQKDLQRAHVTT